MIARIYGPETWEGELQATATWAHPTTRRFGTAELWAPRSSTLFDLDAGGEAKYIYELGGTYVELEHSAFGRWRGVADVPTINRDGMTIECMSLETYVSIQHVAGHYQFEAVPAGRIVEVGFRQAFGGIGTGWIGEGKFDYTGPLILGYEFSGQEFSEVLTHMMDWTGMEWWLDDDDCLNWGTTGHFYPFPLCDDGDVVDSERSGTITEMATQVTALNGLGMELTIMNTDDHASILWPRKVVV